MATTPTKSPKSMKKRTSRRAQGAASARKTGATQVSENASAANAGMVPGMAGVAGGVVGAGVVGVDQELVARAYRKVVTKQELSAAERTALRRHEKQKEERLRWQHYASIPQKHWRQMSGRQTKVLHEQAMRYNLPLGGPTINLPALARALHDFLADNAAKLARDDDELLTGGTSPALERYREERALLARLDRLERQGQLLDREQARSALARIATVLRGAGDSLQQQFGPAARDLLDEALDDAQTEIDRHFPHHPPDPRHANHPLDPEQENSSVDHDSDE